MKETFYIKNTLWQPSTWQNKIVEELRYNKNERRCNNKDMEESYLNENELFDFIIALMKISENDGSTQKNH